MEPDVVSQPFLVHWNAHGDARKINMKNLRSATNYHYNMQRLIRELLQESWSVLSVVLISPKRKFGVKTAGQYFHHFFRHKIL
jgi:hypothetical protein